MKKILRLIYIIYILSKYNLDYYLWKRPQFAFKKNKPPKPDALRKAFEHLGPIFIKFGQVLSTRVDLLPEAVAIELAHLQDNVTPFPGEIAKHKIEKALNSPIGSLFSSFELTPLASASIAQVHAATLFDGSAVVVKVLRPKIKYYIERDVAVLAMLAKLLARFVPKMRRLRPIEVVEEIKSTLFDELDLLREAANASQLRRNFHNSPLIRVPQVYWSLSRTNVLVTERIFGVPIADLAQLRAKNTNLKCLAERGVEIFFTQVFRDCFFHADMHPGNIFVDLVDPENPHYAAVDFGIMGTLGPEDQRYLGENFLAFFQRDYRKVAELHVQSGWVPPHTPINAFESAIRTVCEPIFEKPLKDISFGQTLLRLFQIARRFEMQVQPQLLLLQKTLLNIEGLGRQLYPDLDLWKTAKPFLEKWMKKHYGRKALLRNIKNKLPLWIDKLPELPEALYDIARFKQNETHRLRYQSPPAPGHHNKIASAILVSAVLICATLIALSY